MNKRLIVLILSFATLVCYGYAVGGVGALVLGRPKPLLIAAGFLGGSFCLWLAFRLWRQFLDEVEKEVEARLASDERDERGGPDGDDEK